MPGKVARARAIGQPARMLAAALVLTGGASRRMGRDKAWLELDGVPLLRHVVEQAASVCELVVVAAAPGQALPELPPRVRRVDDPPALHGRGPLAGLVAGLHALEHAGIELAALSSCDAIGLAPAHLHFVLAQLDARPEVIGVVPSEGERLHPLAGAVRVGPALARAHALLDAGEARLSAWASPFARIDASELPDARVLEPCNEPAQWQRLLADRRGG